MPGRLLDLTDDLVFQELFGKQKNKEITKHFLSLILNREITNVDLDVNKRMLGNRENSKTGRLDVRVKFNDGEDCNIELQMKKFEFMPERMLEYWSVMYGNKINCGDKYSVLKPSISILIAGYKLPQLKDIPEYHTKWNLRELNYPDKILTNDIEMHILEIPKINENEMLKDELIQWLNFIKNPGSEEVQKYMEENKYLKQARKELEYLSGDPDFQRLLESRAGFLKDMDNYRDQCEREAKEKGLQEGRLQKQKEIAKKMLEMNMPINQIAEATNMSEEEIKKIQKEN